MKLSLAGHNGCISYAANFFSRLQLYFTCPLMSGLIGKVLSKSLKVVQSSLLLADGDSVELGRTRRQNHSG